MSGRFTRGMGLSKMAWLAVAGVSLIFTAFPSVAELQQVSVGGELRIRGRWYFNVFSPRGERIDPAATGWRPLGPRGTTSIFKWDTKGSDWTRYEHSVLLNVKADFTENVSTFVEFYDFAIWGEDFRSNYLTGADNRANTADDVEINQAYVEARNVFDWPVSVKVGRQALKLGKGWLVCDMMTPTQYLTHDGIRLTWKPADDTTFDAFATKLAERNTGDNDADFYGVYGTYTGIEALTVEAYYLYLRDGAQVETTQLSPGGEWFEGLFGWDSYGHTELSTIGTHLFGKSSGFDYDVELAYQFGDAAQVGAMFIPVGGVYGDTNAKYDNFGAEATLGYTFADVTWQPRPFLMGTYYQGADNRDVSFGDWLNPWYRPEASVNFNRLFSDKNCMPVVNDNGALSNIIQIQAGVEVKPTEKIVLHAHVAKDWIDEPFNPPVSVKIFGNKHYLPFPWWTTKGSDDLGWEVAAFMKYQYSQDLSFLLYGNYLFAGDGLTDGSFIQLNGTEFNGGTDSDDAAYMFWMAILKF